MTRSWSVWRCNRQTGSDPWAGWSTFRRRLRWRSRRLPVAPPRPAAPPVPGGAPPASRRRSAAAGARSATARPRFPSATGAGSAAAGARSAAAGAGAAAAGSPRRPAGSSVSGRPRVAAGARRPVGSGGTTRPAGVVTGRAAKDSQAHEGHSGPSVESHRGLRGSAKPTRGLENLTLHMQESAPIDHPVGLFLRRQQQAGARAPSRGRAEGGPSVGRNVELVQCAAHLDGHRLRRVAFVVDLRDDAAVRVLEGDRVIAAAWSRCASLPGRCTGRNAGRRSRPAVTMSFFAERSTTRSAFWGQFPRLLPLVSSTMFQALYAFTPATIQSRMSCQLSSP